MAKPDKWFDNNTRIEQYGAGATFSVDATASGHFRFAIIAQHFGWSDFYEGKADRINIAGSGKLVAYEDNPTRYAFSTTEAGTSTTDRYLVNRNIIQVKWLGDEVLVTWKVPLVITSTLSIPPGYAVLHGVGDPMLVESSQTYAGGWTGTTLTTVLPAEGMFYCPDWNYEVSISGNVVVNGTYTWTHP
jgi:hypothetical protein